MDITNFLLEKLKTYKEPHMPKVMIVQIGQGEKVAEEVKMHVIDLDSSKWQCIVIIYPQQTSIAHLEYLTFAYEQDPEVIAYEIVGIDSRALKGRSKNFSYFAVDNTPEEEKPVEAVVEAVEEVIETKEEIIETKEETTPIIEVPKRKVGRPPKVDKDTTPKSTPGKSTELKLNEIQNLLKENGIKFKQGTKKAELLKLLTENNIKF